MLYILTNLTNGKKFIGKTNFNEYYLRQLLFSALDNGEHYNKLLQKDWKKHNFKLELIESDDTVKEADDYINKYNLLNPTKGYNHATGGNSNSGWVTPQEVRDKISKAKN